MTAEAAVRCVSEQRLGMEWAAGVVRGQVIAAVCVALMGVLQAGGQAQGTSSKDAAPVLMHTCLITKDVGGLVKFYEPVLQLKAQWSGPDYAEFHTGVGVLAIFSAQAQERYIPRSATAGSNKGVVLEFRVGDVDREFQRLQPLVKTWVKVPTTQPWGTRSIYFRDPDGNLVDFYSPGATR